MRFAIGWCSATNTNEGEAMMRSFGVLALALLVFGPSVGATSIGAGDDSNDRLPTATQAITKLIAGSLSKSTMITVIHLVPVSGAIVTWSAGTGTNCASNTVVWRTSFLWFRRC